eukprot:1434380-Prymnesium_polylepis.1
MSSTGRVFCAFHLEADDLVLHTTSSRSAIVVGPARRSPGLSSSPSWARVSRRWSPPTHSRRSQR